MEGIIILLIITILALPIILLIWVKTSISGSIREVLNKLNYLHVKVDQLQEKKVQEEILPEEEVVDVNESLLDLMEPIKREGIIDEKIIDIELKDSKAKSQEPQEPIIERIERKKDREEKVKRPKRAAFIKTKKSKRDLEKFIGENLINKIGIAILVLGITYFVRHAIDRDWINEVGRVAIGILSGGLLILFAHRIRKTFTAFSSVLLGGAMAVFYYTISIAFHDYQLFSQPVAFTLMVLITGFSVLLSIGYDRKELAVLAIVGAFSSPLMLSNGSGNYQVLFTYITIVNVGMLVLAYFKKWNVVNIVSFALTVLLYAGWYAAKVVGVDSPPYQGALIFATIFYVLFFCMHIINNVKEKRKFKGYEFGLLLSTTALYYSVGMITLHLAGFDHLRGLFTISLGVFNLLFAYPLFKRNSVDKSLIFLLTGVVLTFVSLAAPVQLSGNYITLFWTSEMVLLLWLGQKSGIQFMKLSSLIIGALMTVSLLMDWEQIYFDYLIESLPIMMNKGFITTLFSILGIAVYARLLRNEPTDQFLPVVKVQTLKRWTKIIGGAFIYLIGMIEIGVQLDIRIGVPSLTIMSLLSYTYLFHLGLTVYAKRRLSSSLATQLMIASIALLISYPVFNGFELFVRNAALRGEITSLALIVQYLNLFFMTIIGIQFIKAVRNQYGLRSDFGKYAVWGLSVVGLIIASMHLNHQTVLFFFDQQLENIYAINRQTVKIGYPIIWGVGSFVLMLLGMKYKYRTLRVISLSIFSVILLKLFLFDIKGASEVGKIVAFILLGVLLLVISFMYQKLKNLLLDSDE